MLWDRENEIDDLSNYVREVSARLGLDLKWREVDAVMIEARSAIDARGLVDERLGRLAVSMAARESRSSPLDGTSETALPGREPVHAGT